MRLAVVTDITERIRLEHERNDLLASERAARAQAERASYLKDEFLGTLSHELRTPLNSILLWTQMLLQRVTDTEQVTRGLTAIERSTKVQTQLISDLLDVSGIISGKLRLNVQLLDLAATIKSALEGLIPAIDAKELRLKTWFDPRVDMISGDPARLQQVVWNLVNNASKFTLQGSGCIEIQDSNVIDSHVQIDVSAIPTKASRPNYCLILFERFRPRRRVSSNRVKNGGLGLGLCDRQTYCRDTMGQPSRLPASGPPAKAQNSSSACRLPPPSMSRRSHPSSTTNDAGSNSVNLHAFEGVRVLIVDDDVDTCSVHVAYPHGKPARRMRDVQRR